MSRDLELRVATGTPDFRLGSAVWRIWKAKRSDDIYVAPRHIAGSLKCSLHANGFCYVGVTNEFARELEGAIGYNRKSRTQINWSRPFPVENEWRLAVEITIPPSSLFNDQRAFDKPIFLLEAPPSGKAVTVSIVFSRLPKGEFTIDSACRELAYARLANGEYVVVIARPIDFDYESFKNQNWPLLQARLDRGNFFVDPMTRVGKPLRVMFINDPKPDGTLRLLDAGAILTKAS